MDGRGRRQRPLSPPLPLLALHPLPAFLSRQVGTLSPPLSNSLARSLFRLSFHLHESARVAVEKVESDGVIKNFFSFLFAKLWIPFFLWRTLRDHIIKVSCLRPSFPHKDFRTPNQTCTVLSCVRDKFRYSGSMIEVFSSQYRDRLKVGP